LEISEVIIKEFPVTATGAKDERRIKTVPFHYPLRPRNPKNVT